MRIRCFQNFIDIIRGKKRIKTLVAYQHARTRASRYNKTVRALQKKARAAQKIRVGFYVVYDSAFPAAPVMEEMMKDELFDPFILVIPDMARGEENTFTQMKKTYATLSARYKNVYMAYDQASGTFQDFCEKADMVFFATPYDEMTHELYGINRYSTKGILTLYVSYAPIINHYAIKHIINLPSMNICWRVFADSKENLEEYKKYTAARGKNVVLTGYCKMDALSKVEVRKRERKRVIIAPHHTVAMEGLPLSNFMSYSDLLLRLPKMYPQLDFLFRPHPFLMMTLRSPEIWGKERADAYLAELLSNSNVEHQDGGDYFDAFVNSDALIHDCSSFSYEYLFTSHPCCYILKNEAAIAELYNDFGQQCVKQHYYAYNNQDIINFIDNVVLGGKDTMAPARAQHAEKLKVYYPHSARAIVRHIRKTLKFPA